MGSVRTFWLIKIISQPRLFICILFGNENDSKHIASDVSITFSANVLQRNNGCYSALLHATLKRLASPTTTDLKSQTFYCNHPARP